MKNFPHCGRPSRMKHNHRDGCYLHQHAPFNSLTPSSSGLSNSSQATATATRRNIHKREINLAGTYIPVIEVTEMEKSGERSGPVKGRIITNPQGPGGKKMDDGKLNNIGECGKKSSRLKQNRSSNGRVKTTPSLLCSIFIWSLRQLLLLLLLLFAIVFQLFRYRSSRAINVVCCCCWTGFTNWSVAYICPVVVSSKLSPRPSVLLHLRRSSKELLVPPSRRLLNRIASRLS